ncbi:prepilin-type N-terminal cleavage/methylation domain-containing protein [bacterium]|nr:prepilin-type N-terminal cleavage/methylation domain-containing protein [bacterium]
MLRSRHNPASDPCRGARHAQAGFTLIELLIVIVVITILISLLLPAIASARRNVVVTQVKTDIGQMEAAIAQFRNRFKMDPPSRIVLWEDPDANNGWAATSPSSDAIASRALIREMWPQFDFTKNRDLNGDGDMTDNTLTLTGGECLVFFLGGILLRDGSGGAAPNGFSKNPLDPFASGGNREGPFFEFKTERFSDLDSDDFPEYIDPIPSQTNPYQYFSSYDGAGYNTAEFGSPGFVVWYSQGQPNESTAFNGGGGTDYKNVTLSAPVPYKNKSFQIISPGFDKIYGTGGPFDASATGDDRLPAFELFNGTPSSSTYVSETTLTERSGEYDNITNFHDGGMLRP